MRKPTGKRVAKENRRASHSWGSHIGVGQTGAGTSSFGGKRSANAWRRNCSKSSRRFERECMHRWRKLGNGSSECSPGTTNITRCRVTWLDCPHFGNGCAGTGGERLKGAAKGAD